MKKILILLMVLMAKGLSVQADDYTYPYLTFETSGGNIVSVPVSSLTLTIADGTLTAGSQSFSLSELSKMYFSTADVTAIDEVADNTSEGVEIFTLDGLSLGKFNRMNEATATLKRGVYIVRSNRGTIKIAVQ